MIAHPFDAAAPAYDATFTATRLGRWLRELVRERAGALFAPGDHVLELGCGTGDDAAWLAARGVRVTATDASPAMLGLARARLAAAGLAHMAAFAQLDLAHPPAAIAGPGAEPRYDGALSNFGPLNCVADRRPAAKLLARSVRPGGKVALVLMGPLCLWEIGWHMARMRPRDALRRLRAGAPAGVGGGASVRVWYPSPGRLRAELAPHFRHLETVAVGALLPPSYLSRVVERHPRPFEALALLERRVAGRFPWPWLSDHYLAIFERRPL